MGIKRKTFEFIKYYKLTEPSSLTVCGEGEKDFPITLMTLDMFGS